MRVVGADERACEDGAGTPTSLGRRQSVGVAHCERWEGGGLCGRVQKGVNPRLFFLLYAAGVGMDCGG